ncbi:2-C-methyl-D-erythritol 4-phosphate cytidylyltransferase [Nitritalea halalkaliphila LW7]|uniref:2-C-methyl-D-erythritol 4-phosphate cytidylyltransferase n=1 Tax=Nitritalea halalkaliphila LW7 TaxID=1189621 RepID=I5C0T7_9BACT|nr:2-C-methyl-D-erythritol 4-phosphate cytidylyltransferase [Nitritalea halalkaliphila]EIM75439.1 2-C-methyl-D-erythritol 4-phosphate cytidylyltransferase [Nitritalea halalkaliphila LW7]
MKRFVIIVAGGNGSRMGASISKQYLEIGGRPVLIRTLEKFATVVPDAHLLLVLPERDFLFWEALCAEHGSKVAHQVVAGGQSRFQSVRNGLRAIPPQEGLVAIHDGVRPFVADEVIRKSFVEAETHGSAVAVVSLKDSIREIEDSGRSRARERQAFRLVQTPQTFRLEAIQAAFTAGELAHFTDDATVYEHSGKAVHLIAGNLENIKITTPEDMEFAAYLLAREGN